MCAGNLTTIDSDNLISALNLKFLHVKLDSPCENRKCIDPFPMGGMAQFILCSPCDGCL